MEDDNPNPYDQMPTKYWVASDYRLSEWSYFWVSFPSAKVPHTWYRVYEVETPPTEWKPMKPKRKVYQKTGFDDEGDNEDKNFKLCAAEKLRMGKYRFEVKVRVGDRDYEIGGTTFKVLGQPIRGGWG